MVVFAAIAAALVILAISRHRKSKQNSRIIKEENQVAWPELARGVFESETSSPTDERLRLALATGAKKLGLGHGIIARHKEDSCQVVSVFSSGYDSLGGISAGQKMASRRIFCGEIRENGGTLAIDFASLSEWRRHAAFQQLGWETYLGCRVMLAEGEYITLSFFQDRCRDHLFSRNEKDFLLQLTKWVVALMQRDNIPKLESLAGAATDAQSGAPMRATN